jgi:hypothetical protein
MFNNSQEMKIPKLYTSLINQIFEIERKLQGTEDYQKVARNIERMKDVLCSEISSQNDNFEIFYENPMGQTYDETRNDLDAHIVGEATENLVVVDVIKPIIRVGNRQKGLTKVVQRAVVTVESKVMGKE